MNLQVISFAWKAFEKTNVKSVNLMTNAWDITILDEHTPIVSVIKPCVVFIEYFNEKKIIEEEQLVVWGWVVEVVDSEVKILADMLADKNDINKEEELQAVTKAEEMMEKYKNSKDRVDMEKFIEAEDMLLKSVAKLKISDIK